MDKDLKVKEYDNCVIRPLKIGDLKFLPNLYKEYYVGNTGIETDIKKMFKNFKKLRRDKHMNFVGIEKDNEIIGFVHIVLNEDILDTCDPFITLWTLRVAPKYRQQGYGKKLLSYVEDYAKLKKAIFITMSSDKANTNANALYKKMGYKENYAWLKQVGK